MNESNIKTENQRRFYEKTKNFSDRELQEYKAYLLSENLKNTNSIRNNILFFFYACLAGVLITILATIK